jgi:integrase
MYSSYRTFIARREAAMAARAGRRDFGYVRRLPSGRWQASYLAPDGKRYTARTEDGRPMTFDTRSYAGAWLSRVHGDIQAGRWVSAKSNALENEAPAVTLAAYAESWMAGRDLSGSTRVLYGSTLRKQILPALGEVPVTAITPPMVRDWHAKLRTQTGPTQRARAYSLLRTIMNTAIADEVIASNPCRVRGAGAARRARQIRPATLAELETIAGSVPPRYKLMILLAAWCALRFGELAELRRADIDLRGGVVHVRRGVIRTPDGRAVKGPKSEAGKRDVAIPPHLMPIVRDHMARHVAASRDALVFPASENTGLHIRPSSLYAVYHPARDKAGRPDLRFHDLRHTGAVLAAATGATLAELMARLGHSTVTAAMRYQHAAADRDKAIAAALSDLAAGTVTPISSKRREA